MAVEIPVVIDIDKAFQEAAKKVDRAIVPLMNKLSKSTLKLDLVTDEKKGIKSLRSAESILKSSTISAKELSAAMADVRNRMVAMESAGGFNPAKGLKKAEKELLALYSALEFKASGGSLIDRTANSVVRLGNEAAVAGQKARGAINTANAGLRTQNSLLGMLTGYLSAYTAVFAGVRLIRNIRETTAEFEMQRVALAGIIQDATKADQLFGQIKKAAVESPFEIKNLVSFTKQLSAYRIETDKLFDVTMRLADVSAGLGVDMSRLVLAYGQVRAASVLRGQELRQFTEAGIPLVDLLAKKFSQLRGEMVSTGEVFELISDRAVPFSMIEDIFNDMTDAGGIFYQMQLKQSETLKGQWMKLKDVISIAYDEMGRSATVNQAMVGWIHMISSLVKNWERIASVMNVVVWSYVAYQAAVRRLIPFYNLQQKATARQIMLEKQHQIEQIRLASKTDVLTASEKKRIAQLKVMTAEDYKRIYAMDKMSQSQAMLFYWRNKDNKEIVKAITQTGILTKAQMSSIKSMNLWQVLIKGWGASIRTFFTSVGTAVASFWPIAAISSLITLTVGLINKNKAQTEAIRKVDKAYNEQAMTLLSIENAYRRIQKAIEDVSNEQERSVAEAASFGEKLKYAQKVVEALKKFGLGGDFDLSLLNTDNIDEFVDKWLAALTKANELTRDWGRSVAEVANAFEASILGFHLAGDNLSTDIKQLTSSFVKMTSGKQYRNDVSAMREYIDQLEIQYKEYYDILSDALGEEAKLAIASKRRNESEYEYQMRLIKNYEKIRKYAQSDRFMLSGAMKSFKPMDSELAEFERRLHEVDKEFEKTVGSFKGQDEVTIKMAIDKVFAENQWDDWLKEAWIERLNGKYNMNISVTPTFENVDVPKGMKGIIATEFAGLFTEQELANMNSVTAIGAAIEEKMKKAAKAIKEADLESNNLQKDDSWAAKAREKILKAQEAIEDELAKDEKDRNKEAIEDNMALIDALTSQNDLYEEQIEKKKQSAKAEYDLAKAAKERLLNEGLSDMGQDIKQAFPGLLKDAYKEATDENYISRYLISDEDLLKIKDGVDAYDLFAKNMKAIAEDKKKMVDAGVTEATVAEEQNRLDAQRIELQAQLARINGLIAESNYEELKPQYESLRLAVQQATTAVERKEAEDELNRFVKESGYANAAALVIEKQRLTAQLGITNAALGAKNAIIETFAAMDKAEEFWKEFGKRYNFTYQPKQKGAGQDPWILLYKNRMKFMQDFQKGVENLDKYLAHSASLGRERGIMKGRGLSLGIDTDELKGDADELRKWYSDAINDVVAKIQSMGGKQFSGLGVTEILAKDLKGRKIQKYQELLQELWKGLTDFDTDQLKKEIDTSLKRLADEVKRSETVRNFFNDILSLTGDEELATQLSIGVYGDIGKDFSERMQQQLNEALKSVNWDGVSSEDQSTLTDAFANQDFPKILEMLDLFPEKWQTELKKMAADNEKFNADFLKDLYKTYEKTKTFDERRTLVTQREQNKRNEILANKNLTKEQKDEFIASSQQKEGREIAAIDVEELKATYEWTKAFEDLDRVGNTTLENLRQKIEQLINLQRENLTPEQLKTLTKELEKIKNVQAERNPFYAIGSGAQRAMLITGALNAQKTGKDYDKAIKKIQKFNKTARETDKIDFDHLEDSLMDANKTMEDGIKGLGEYMASWKSVIDTVTDAFNLDDIPVLGETLQGVSDSLNFVATILPVIITLNAILNTTLMANPFIAMAAAIVATIGAIVGLIKGLINAKVERLNKKIEEQTELLDRLEYSYDRLNKAIEKTFGSDYITNFQQQMKVLEAQAEAYRKQADLERQKGKKSDAKAVKEYEDKLRDVEDDIKDAQGQISEFFTEMDVTSAATDFAGAWIDAYREFSSTSDAIGEKFQEMIQNMVVKSMAAKIVQQQLQPIFDYIDELSADDAQFSPMDAALVAQKAQETLGTMNTGLSNLMTALEGVGLNMRTMGSGLTGIARDIQGASEESILGLAAGINTQNFYISQIHQNVLTIANILSGGAAMPTVNVSAIAETDPMREHISNININLAELLRKVNSVITTGNANTNTAYIAIK